MRHLFAIFLTVGHLALPASAASFYVAPDVPVDRSGTTFRPWDVARNDDSTYGLSLSFPADVRIAALHRMCDGDWLIACGAPVDLGGGAFDPRDVVRFDGASYVPFLCGGLLGIESGSGVDGAFLIGGDGGDLVLSFDRPTDLTALGGGFVEPADLARFAPGGAGCANWSYVGLEFDASAASPPLDGSTNVVGSDATGGGVVMTFDVPTTLGATTHLPGEIVSWDGAVFATYQLDPTWPVSARVYGLSFLSGPGAVAATLTVDPSEVTPGDLRLTWQPSAAAGAEEYGIYEGTLGTWWSHELKDCFDDVGDSVEEITPQAGNTYYLVVPRNSNGEGSYGIAFGEVERPAGTPACAPEQDLRCP